MMQSITSRVLIEILFARSGGRFIVSGEHLPYNVGFVNAYRDRIELFVTAQYGSGNRYLDFSIPEWCEFIKTGKQTIGKTTIEIACPVWEWN